MPVKRRASKQRNHKITDEVVALFERCVAIERSAADEAWEDEGGRCREYLDAEGKLDGLLGLPPWHMSPADPALDGEMPEYMRNGGLCIADTWDDAKELRAELLKRSKGMAR